MSKFHDIIKEYREKYLTENKTRYFKTYASWKRAVKAIDPSVEFKGDKDIDSAGAKGKYHAEWDGEEGTIEKWEQLSEDMNSNEEEESTPQEEAKKKKIENLDRQITDETIKDKEEELRDLKQN